MNQIAFWTVATVMVVLATTAVVAPMFWLRSADAHSFGRRRLLSAAAIAALLPLCALSLYALLGSPGLVGSAAIVAGADGSLAPHAGTMPGGPPTKGSAVASRSAGELGTAVARLEARLAAQPNDPSGWELLAQSYDFQGRPEDAAGARLRRVPTERVGSGAAAQGPAPLDAAALAAVAALLPSATDALVQQAQEARRARDFPRAIAAFQTLARQGKMDAGLWADYADATAAQRGQLDEASELLIRKALALEPTHPKALWLLGSLQVQRRDFTAALESWQRLQSVLPPDSSDARLIADNVAEARAMLDSALPQVPQVPTMKAATASGAGTVAATARPAPAVRTAASVALRGDVELDARWRGKVPPRTVLYVFAKAVGKSGPPVAVLRTTVAAWPFAFVLDDTLAMLPGRTLSSAGEVVVEARLSRSGSADPQPGDLRGHSVALDPRKAGHLRIVIAEEIT